MSCDELLDLVSSEDVVIGVEKKSLFYEKNLSYFRVINGFICNENKELWIPRRHPSKKLFPLHMDASVGGHVQSGETYDAAFVREAEEELGIAVENYAYKKITYLTPTFHKTSAFMWVYLIHTNSVPLFNKNDFVSFDWLTVDQFFKKIADGDKAKSDLVPILMAIKELL